MAIKENTTRSKILSFSIKLKPIIFVALFLFNFNCAEAQFWKFRSNAKKIDSLELEISQARKLRKKELRQSNKLTTRLLKKIDSISLELEYVNCVLDSLKMEEENKITEEIITDSIDSFCPDDEMLEQVEYLNNCCCLLNEGCPNKTTEGGLRIVREGYQMAILRKEIVVGSCWDFINAVYDNAGVNKNKRENVYTEKKGTKYPTPELLQPGDWIYHVNYSYHNIEHSAIFICWENYEERKAVTLSYVGQNKSVPGKYSVYDLSGVYNIKRAIE